VAHHGIVLADTFISAHGAQPHAQQHGLHHRGGDRVPERQWHDPAGKRDALRVLLSASFDKDGQKPDRATGTLSLYHADRKVGEGHIKTQLGAFAIAGAGLYVGRDPGEAITEDYPGESPYPFTGGTINRVAVDFSGEPYIDLEREAALMLMRE
jgi:hypothetical protein